MTGNFIFRDLSNQFLVENTSPGDYVTEMDDQLMQMILDASAREAALMNSTSADEEQRLMEQAIQDSIREVPNPDLMNYEQLQELTDKLGNVSKGYSEEKLKRLRPKANFDFVEDCPICIDRMEIA